MEQILITWHSFAVYLRRAVIRLNYTAVSEVIRALLDFLSGLNVASDAGEFAL
jgi:hypothetical protein